MDQSAESLNFVLYGLLPLLVFVVVDAFARNIFWAVACAVLCSLSELVLLYLSTNRIDPVSVTATVLFILLGLFSIKRHDKIYFKMQPAILALLLAGFVAYLQFIGEPIVYRYLPLLEKAAPPLIKKSLSDQEFLAVLDMMFDWLIVVILLDGALIAYTALKCRQEIWLLANAVGLWIIGFLMLIAIILSSYFFGIPDLTV